MWSLTSGGGTRNHLGCFANPQKTQKICCKLLTTPRKYDIITISLIIDPHIALALRFRTYVSLYYFTLALYGAERRLTRVSAQFWRVYS